MNTGEQIDLLREALPDVKFTVWLKLDTGMNRLGFKGAASHLSSADTGTDTTAGQLAQFSALTGLLEGERSIANSAGLLGFADAQADWVRPGLLLYGASPFAATIGPDYGLLPVMTLHSHVSAPCMTCVL